MSKRPFRQTESLLAEQVTRHLVLGFLQDRGFTIESDMRVRNGQTIAARTPGGEQVTMRVKLCWRRGSDRVGHEHTIRYSAAQLMARITGNNWLGSIKSKMAREQSRGATHLLLVQRDGAAITLAALVPISAVAVIWRKQRDVSNRLIRTGMLERRRKNHAKNGSSPTLWLQDDAGGQKVAEALWRHPDVLDLSLLPRVVSHSFIPEEVTDPAIYQEGACRTIAVNAYERDERARWKCIEVHGTDCFICGFSFAERYGAEAEGYIHVHHLRPLSRIASNYSVDPAVDLRPLCPNCHAVVHLNGGCRSIEEVRQMLTLSHRDAEQANSLTTQASGNMGDL
jgi:5-methylcytosine-specific restriction enzyme A